MDTTEKHYARLLGLDSPWKVTRVKLSVDKQRVDIFIEYGELTGFCPECGSACRVYDHSPGRTWRHLDTMKFGTYLHCEPPRAECEQHGIKTLRIPWAGKHSRFTQLFEAFAIEVVLAGRSLKDVGELLGLGWYSLHSIMKRAVERGLERRSNDDLAWIGMDEKSFRKGHDYISLLNDLEEVRVLEQVEYLAKADLGVVKAWYIKELFRHFWTRHDAAFARSIPGGLTMNTNEPAQPASLCLRNRHEAGGE